MATPARSPHVWRWGKFTGTMRSRRRLLALDVHQHAGASPDVMAAGLFVARRSTEAVLRPRPPVVSRVAICLAHFARPSPCARHICRRIRGEPRQPANYAPRDRGVHRPARSPPSKRACGRAQTCASDGLPPTTADGGQPSLPSAGSMRFRLLDTRAPLVQDGLPITPA